MNVIQKLAGLCRESPTYDRDRSAISSGITIGITGIALNGAVMFGLLPFMIEPDDYVLRGITQSVGLGQLLTLLLLGGATAIATVLIPLRLVTVFWGPRIGRYFDQIVLSGISPLRFVIGKVLTENVFLRLILFLMLPYIVLSLTLGGVSLPFFLCGVLLIWLYCVALALVTLWLSLYLNELLSAGIVIWSAGLLCLLGCAPIPLQVQPFSVTPLPVLIHPIRVATNNFGEGVPGHLPATFACCFLVLAAVACVALLAIAMGPLYGIIRENSTFGEVVRAGDTKRKRKLRLRLHIQRSSEIAFFYENRGPELRTNEGLLRWGSGFAGLLALSGLAHTVLWFVGVEIVPSLVGSRNGWWAYDFHAACITVQAVSVVLAILLFSHARNSTYLSVPFCRGRRAQVATLDTVFFLLFVGVVTAASIGYRYAIDRFLAAPNGATFFPDAHVIAASARLDYHVLTVEGSLIVGIAGVGIYCVHRLACLSVWMKSVGLLGAAAVYGLVLNAFPAILTGMMFEVESFGRIAFVREWVPVLLMTSPVAAMANLFGELGRDFPLRIPNTMFYVGHAALIAFCLWQIRKRGPRVQQEYLKREARA